ncbi:ABC transporter C family member 10 [Linum perenne]
MLEKLSFLDEKFNWIIVSILHLLLVITMIAIIPALEELYWLLEMRGFCATISFRHFWKLHSVRVSLRLYSVLSRARIRGTKQMEEEGLWIMFCSASQLSCGTGKECSPSMLVDIFDPNSCPNHILVLSMDLLIMLIILCIFIYNKSSLARELAAEPLPQSISKLLILSAICNSLLSILYLGIGIWEVSKKLGRHQTVLPLHGWMVVLVQGAVLMMSCAFRTKIVPRYDQNRYSEAVDRPLLGEEGDSPTRLMALDDDSMGCPFANAGFFSKVSFWWLNPLMKKGKERVLQDEDIPHLRKEEQARTCYLKYLDQLRKWKGNKSFDPPVLWSVILACYKKEIWVSGLFALIKVLTLSAGPLLLRAFINVAERKLAFQYEGYVITVALLLAKCIESIAERQYHFQTRLVGVRVRSLLTAAIYQKQLVLSNAAKTTHSPALRIVQQPITMISDVATMFIDAKVSLDRIAKFLEAPELQQQHTRRKGNNWQVDAAEFPIFIQSSEISWSTDTTSMATLRNINLVVKFGEKVAICGEVGSGKSTLLAAVFGEVPRTNGTMSVHGKIAYVSQTAWIQTATIRENILFGSVMEPVRYREVLERCCLVKDLEMLPNGDFTEIGERGVNLSGGQKQRIQLARALYQDADVYLLDDPFSAVDAHTATNLFNEYVMGALSGKTSLILLMSSGEILNTGTYDRMLGSCQEFHELVNAHKNRNDWKMQQSLSEQTSDVSNIEILKVDTKDNITATSGDQLIMKEERETGDTGFKPYREYLSKRSGFLFCFLTAIFHILFLAGQLVQNYLLAADIDNPEVSKASLLMIYTVIGCILPIFMLFRSIALVKLGCDASESIFFTLLNSLFRAPMSFYDSTPLGRILSRVSSDLSIIDLELAFKLTVSMGSTMNTFINLALLAILAWPVLFIIIPILYLIMVLQRYYFSTAKELMRINGTTKSSVVSHLAESIAGAMTIRAFEEEDRFFSKNLEFIDNNASTYFHTFSASQWLIQRLEIPCAIVLSASACAMTLLPLGSSGSGFVGMALSYGLSLNVFLIVYVQYQCFVQESIISVERLEQYMHIPSEAPEVLESSRPAANWPSHGKVEICNLKVRYQKNSPWVLKGISCNIEGGDKIVIVGRTGSGKTTLISSLFRLVEPTEGRIIVDGIDISTIGLHDLRSHFGIIPQDPTLFCGSVRAVLRKSKILVLDEATASIDNATDAILQRTIRTEFAECTVITVAHRIPTVMDSTKVLAISEGKLAEYDEPGKLMNEKESLFRSLVEEYWSLATNS